MTGRPYRQTDGWMPATMDAVDAVVKDAVAGARKSIKRMAGPREGEPP